MRLTAAELAERADSLGRRLASCDLCPRCCAVNRLADDRGYCGTGQLAPLATALPHFGEEPPISGQRGSGTIFFGGCNLRCVYCQNRQISARTVSVREVESSELATAMLDLATAGCHNISFVTGTHVAPQILAALAVARGSGLDLPIVWNSGGYESVDSLRALDGVVDIYLPDLKYSDGACAAELSNAPDYWERACDAVREMVRQVGALELDEHGYAKRGVIVRHLVLPNELAGSRAVLEFVAGLTPRPALSLLAQFYPIPECEHALLQRPIFAAEYERVTKLVAELGFSMGWVQDLSSENHYRPDFTRADPFCEPDGGQRLRR